jgi:hypothetical protein
VGARRSAGDVGLSREQESDRRDGEHDADDGEGIAERKDECLPLDDLAQFDDRQMLGRGGVGNSIRQK